MSRDLAPVLLFVYNRPAQTKKTLENLAANRLAQDSELFIFADGPKKGTDPSGIGKIKEVREIIKEKQWCKTVHIVESQVNNGLANSIINGVSEIVNRFSKAIVLEDDLVTSEGFLEYMNHALDIYEPESRVMQISGYQFPIGLPANQRSFFLPLTTSWGWGTWKRAWQHFDVDATGYQRLKSDSDLRRKFDLDGSFPYTQMLFRQMEKKDIDSWAIRWWWSVFQAGGISLFPDQTLIKNIGFGQDASHTKGDDPFATSSFSTRYGISSYPEHIIEDPSQMRRVEELLRNSRKRPGILQKLASFIKFRLTQLT